MTVSVFNTVMTADETPESGHECNYFLDRQLQNKLLEQDEILEASELFAKLNTHNGENKNNAASKVVFARADAIIGWINDSKVVLRRPEKEVVVKNVIQNGYQTWKDARNKQNLQDSYVFKHYYDTHGYIEQYRRDHTNVFIYRSPTSIQGMQGEGIQRYSSQANNSPSQISQQQSSIVCSQCSSSNSVSNYITAALQYTNRCSSVLPSQYSLPQYGNHTLNQLSSPCAANSNVNSNRPSAHSSSSHHRHHHHHHHHNSACKKHKHHVDSASQAFKYKLAPETYWGTNTNSGNTVTRSESQNSLESDKTSASSGADIRTPKITSAKGGKTPTKVSVPVNQNQLQTVPSQNTQVRVPETTVTTPVRALDTLACVAADKQNPAVTQRVGGSRRSMRGSTSSFWQESQDLEVGMLVSEDGSDVYSDHSDAISISQLSTACLGADVRIKSDKEELEPSCTFHVFPNEYALDNTISVLNTRSVTWYPAASAVVQTPKPPRKEWNAFQSSLKTYRSESSANFRNDTLGNSAGSRASRNSPMRRAQSETKLDLPLISNNGKLGRLVASDIQLLDQVIFNNERQNGGNDDTEDLPVMRPKTEKTKTQKNLPAGKARQMKCLRQKFAGYVYNTRNNKQAANIVAEAKQQDNDEHSGRMSVKDSDKNSRVPSPILQYLKSNEGKERVSKSSQSQRSTTSSKQRLAEQKSLAKVAEYLLCERNILVGGSPREPAGVKKDLPIPDQEGNPKDENLSMEGLTWCEKLELLRSVNKRKEKKKVKAQKLTFYKDTNEQTLPVPLVREATRAQLYEQRRIKHLLQQARMKGLNQFDWLNEHESPRFRHSNSADSDSDSDASNDGATSYRHMQNSKLGHTDGALLSRYNMKKSVKGDNLKTVPSINRTNTEVFQD